MRLFVAAAKMNTVHREHEPLLRSVRVGLLLNSQLYNHNFRDVNPRCDYCQAVNTTKHFLIQCRRPNHRIQLSLLHDALDDIGVLDHFNMLNQNEKIKFLLYGDLNLFNFALNSSLILLVAKFIAENHDRH